jgi:hypothetical protein
VLEAILLLLHYREGNWLAGSPGLENLIHFGASNLSITGQVDAAIFGPPASFKLSYEATREDLKQANLSSFEPRLSKIPSSAGAYLHWSSEQKPEIEYFSARRQSTPTEAPDKRRLSPFEQEAILLEKLKKNLISAYIRGFRNGGSRSPFEKLQRMWSVFHGEQHELDVIPVSNNPESGEEVVIREAKKPIPKDITSLAQARELAPSREDIPKMVPLHHLSSGQISLLSFAGPLIFRDKPADLVLIDEPEQHLHVRWQRFLVPALRELAPNAQFFVATHSVEILDSALSYERFILSGTNEPDPFASEEARV